MYFYYFLYSWIFVTVAYGYVNEELQRCYDIENGINRTYSTSDSLCCDGKVVNHQHYQFDCHNGRIYDVQKQGVCGDRLYKLVNGRNQCFGDSFVYDTREKMECGGVLHDRKEGYECCASHTMNVATEVCCRVRGDYVALSPEACCRQRTEYTRSPMCCGGEPYSDTTHLCCEETLFLRNGTNRCVRDEPSIYDTRTHVKVYGDRIVPIVDGKSRACKEATFDPFSQICDYAEFEVMDIGSANGGMCGSESYNKDVSMCCHGNENSTIYYGIPEIPGITACGSWDFEPYLTSNTMDCQGVRHSRSPDGQWECCGTDVFNTTEKMCCGGSIVDKISPTTSCCHDLGYEPHKQTCLIWGDLSDTYAKVVEGVYRKNEICGGQILGKNEFCAGVFSPFVVKGRKGDTGLCENTPYNDKKFFCSRRGKLVPRIPGMEVCSVSHGEELYDPTVKICCYDRLWDKTTECGLRKCCGLSSFPYTPALQTCGPQDEIVDIPSNVSDVCGSSVYDTREHMCDERNSLVVKRSKNQRKPFVCWVDDKPKRYDNETEICCENQLFNSSSLQEAACCGSKMYDSASHNQICCDNVLHDTLGIPKQCDGAIAYSTEEQVCDGVLYNKTDGECCWSGVYNPDTEHCCGNYDNHWVKIPKMSDTEQCCGHTVIDITDSTKVCCGGLTLHNYIDGYECCGTSLIDPLESVCLDGQYAISRGFQDSTCDPSTEQHPEGTCCAGILHVGQFGTCDGLRVIPMEDNPLWCGTRLLVDGEECCAGSYIFSKSDHRCTDGQVIPLCDGNVYDLTTQTCCSGKIIDNSERICCSGRVRRIENGENSCCGRAAYNNQTSFCCKKTVRSYEDDSVDLHQCCPGDQVFSLRWGKCLDREPQACNIFGGTKRSTKMVKTAACSSTLHTIITVKATSSNSQEMTVTARQLSRPCPYCAPSSSGNAILRQIHTVILPEGCTGTSFVLSKKYLILDSSIPDLVSGSLRLTSDALIFRKGAAKVAMGTYQDGGCP